MINELIKKRLSTRAYSDKPVEKDKLMDLFEAARWAPSSRNEQPWQFILTFKSEEAYKKLFNTLSESNKVWAGKAPVLILALAKKTTSRNDELNKFNFYDTGSAVALLSLRATELGLSVHQLGGFNAREASIALNVPDNYEPVVVLVVGYKGDESELPDNLRARENTARARKSLEDIVFLDEFGKTFFVDEKPKIH